MRNRDFIVPLLLTVLAANAGIAQKLLPFKLPDTGQTTGYAATAGKDADYLINPPSFTDNGDGTVTDNNTGLQWQKSDGGEMTVENAASYVKTLSLGGHGDWRLPTNRELFSINNYDAINPALNTLYFTKTAAEYWWTSETLTDDTSRVWVVNAGGGTGAHPKTETVSAGGTRKIHVRAVRDLFGTTFSVTHFTDNGNGTITDNFTGLMWQQTHPSNAMTWEDALAYARSVTLGGASDWRLPNIKELQSLSDMKRSKPTIDKTCFTNMGSGLYWSATSLNGKGTMAWNMTADYGLVSYADKSTTANVLLVRGGLDKKDIHFTEALIPGGDYEMGDHFGFVDPAHPSDETPIHTVRVDSLYMQTTETTNEQFLAFLNEALKNGSIEVRNNLVYRKGDTILYAYTNQSASFYSIACDGKTFSMADFRSLHPMVGVMWSGAAAFCNWLSTRSGLDTCYDVHTWACDFTKNGYRLPTEAEWEWAGRGGHTNLYLNYPFGNSIEAAKANLPASGDPYETGALPNSTPAGFYDGTPKRKTDYNWPGAVTTYQTSNGANDFGLYDMQGNVWEFVNDWYGQNYYSVSPHDNPKGPDSGFIMPDGKPYRGMRGGNWYNGLVTNGVNDGHSRVSNRNPSYYRGPQDPNHPWYHVGFRVARAFARKAAGIRELPQSAPEGFRLRQNYPNPFRATTTIAFSLPSRCTLSLVVTDAFGREVRRVAEGPMEKGSYEIPFSAERLPTGAYFCRLQAGRSMAVIPMQVVK